MLALQVGATLLGVKLILLLHHATRDRGPPVPPVRLLSVRVMATVSPHWAVERYRRGAVPQGWVSQDPSGFGVPPRWLPEML